MITLSATTHALRLKTTAATSVDYTASWADNTSSGLAPDSSQGNVASSTTTTVVPAPGAGDVRGVGQISILNRSSSASHHITVLKDVSGTEYHIQSATLQPGDALQYDGAGWRVIDPNGRTRTAPAEDPGITGYSEVFSKSGGAADTVGYWAWFAGVGGAPAAWSAGTSGVAGRAPDGTAVADAGCIPYRNAGSGTMFLTGFNLFSSVAHPFWLLDVLWVNNGLVVTTTTAQAVGSVAFAARDANGSANGEGCRIGMWFTGTASNGAAISNSTIEYTNSAGTPGRTATLIAAVGHQIPPTALVNTIVWFALQDGDTGVQSIEEITLNTSLGAGSISLFVARVLAAVAIQTVNTGLAAVGLDNPGVRLYDGTCMHVCYRATATTATVVGGQVTLMER